MTRKMLMCNFFMLQEQRADVDRFVESVEYVEGEREGSPLRSRADKKWGGAMKEPFG